MPRWPSAGFRACPRSPTRGPGAPRQPEQLASLAPEFPVSQSPLLQRPKEGRAGVGLSWEKALWVRRAAVPLMSSFLPDSWFLQPALRGGGAEGGVRALLRQPAGINSPPQVRPVGPVLGFASSRSITRHYPSPSDAPPAGRAVWKKVSMPTSHGKDHLRVSRVQRRESLQVISHYGVSSKLPVLLKIWAHRAAPSGGFS